RLRDREVRRLRADTGRDVPRLPELHVARAGAGGARRRALRPVLARDRPLRARHAAPGAPREERVRGDRAGDEGDGGRPEGAPAATLACVLFGVLLWQARAGVAPGGAPTPLPEASSTPALLLKPPDPSATAQPVEPAALDARAGTTGGTTGGATGAPAGAAGGA